MIVAAQPKTIAPKNDIVLDTRSTGNVYTARRQDKWLPCNTTQQGVQPVRTDISVLHDGTSVTKDKSKTYRVDKFVRHNVEPGSTHYQAGWYV